MNNLLTIFLLFLSVICLWIYSFINNYKIKTLENKISCLEIGMEYVDGGVCYLKARPNYYNFATNENITP